METKQVIVIRKDLKMQKGKAASQIAHASMAAILHGMGKDWMGNVILMSDNEMEHWLEHSFTKICVVVNSEEELLEVYKNAQIAGLNGSLIKDNGKTVFNGVPTYTTCAIGPNEVSRVDKITDHLKLY